MLTPFYLLRRDLTATQVTWLVCPFGFAGAFCLLGYTQVRWLGFFAAAVCLSAMVAAHFAYDSLPREHFARRRAFAALLTLALLVQPVIFCGRQILDLRTNLAGTMVHDILVYPVLNKRLAYALKASPQRPQAVIADPNLAPSLGYFAGIPCLASFYWENTEGLHDTVRFFTTKDPVEAHAVAVRTGATHVIIPAGGTLPNYFYYVAYGHYDPADTVKTFVARLLQGKAPLWIQPDTVLNFITTSTYSYRGTPVNNHLETFRIQD